MAAKNYSYFKHNETGEIVRIDAAETQTVAFYNRSQQYTVHNPSNVAARVIIPGKTGQVLLERNGICRAVDRHSEKAEQLMRAGWQIFRANGKPEVIEPVKVLNTTPGKVSGNAPLSPQERLALGRAKSKLAKAKTLTKYEQEIFDKHGAE